METNNHVIVPLVFRPGTGVLYGPSQDASDPVTCRHFREKLSATIVTNAPEMVRYHFRRCSGARFIAVAVRAPFFLSAYAVLALSHQNVF